MKKIDISNLTIDDLDSMVVHLRSTINGLTLSFARKTVANIFGAKNWNSLKSAIGSDSRFSEHGFTKDITRKLNRLDNGGTFNDWYEFPDKNFKVYGYLKSDSFTIYEVDPLLEKENDYKESRLDRNSSIFCINSFYAKESESIDKTFEFSRNLIGQNIPIDELNEFLYFISKLLLEAGIDRIILGHSTFLKVGNDYVESKLAINTNMSKKDILLTLESYVY